MPYGHDQAVVDALIDTIEFELRAQLAGAQLSAPESRLELEDIKDIAMMVADQVLVEFEVSPRVSRPVDD